MNSNVRLVKVTEENWMEIAALSVREDQKEFLDSPIGIIARGYIYRECNGRVMGIANEERMVGVALVRDLDEEPRCYDLQQFMIDQRFQRRGYGEQALRLILSLLKAERRFDCVEVCVKNTDDAALKLYAKAGFTDTGYIDPDLPQFVNWMYYFDKE